MIKIILNILCILFVCKVAIASVEEVEMKLDLKRPLFLKVSVSELGPNFQCHYGLMNDEILFPVFMNTEPLDPANNYSFSEVIKYDIINATDLHNISFASRIKCWVLDGNKSNILFRPGVVQIEIYQDENSILFHDQMNGFERVSAWGDLWISSMPKILKRVKIN